MAEPPPDEPLKWGSLRYLAKWQGLRGEDLDIDLSEERVLVCSRSGKKKIFTGDLDKFRDAVTDDTPDPSPPGLGL